MRDTLVYICVLRWLVASFVFVSGFLSFHVKVPLRVKGGLSLLLIAQEQVMLPYGVCLLCDAFVSCASLSRR